MTDINLNTLSEYRHKKVLKAQDWEDGGQNLRAWLSWQDLIIYVPIWTIIKNNKDWNILADLDKNNQKLLILNWWKGGFWNAHFCSSTRQAPAFAELWDISEEIDLKLELKLVADIGIIWIPSSWKSTFIWTITNVKAKVWDYPFTTLVPNLWVLDYKWKSLVFEDVPWLIPWASKWKGLWIEFLKHIERTWVLLHLLDLSRLDKIFSDYEDIRLELWLFSVDLLKKDEIVVFSKWDLLDFEMKNFIISEFKDKHKNKDIFIISSLTREGVDVLLDYLIDKYAFKKDEENSSLDTIEEIKLYDFKEDLDPRQNVLNYLWDLVFELHWERIEQIVRMTDFSNPEAILRIYDVLEKMMIIRKIEAKLKSLLINLDNSFFFEWNDDSSDFSPKLIIAWKEIALDKLRYKL